MQSAKEKISNMGSAAKLHINICKAKAEEKVEKATARTEEEKEIAHERRKIKEAQAKMELHQEKAEHAAEKLRAKQSHSHQLYGKPHMPFAEPPGMAGGHARAHALVAPPTTTYPFGKQPRVTEERHKFI